MGLTSQQLRARNRTIDSWRGATSLITGPWEFLRIFINSEFVYGFFFCLTFIRSELTLLDIIGQVCTWKIQHLGRTYGARSKHLYSTWRMSCIDHHIGLLPILPFNLDTFHSILGTSNNLYFHSKSRDTAVISFAEGQPQTRLHRLAAVEISEL